MPKPQRTRKLEELLPADVNRAEMGMIIDVTAAAITTYAERGILVPAAISGRYKTAESLHRYHDNLRKQAQGRRSEGGIDVAEEKAKLARAQREEVEIRLQKSRGELIEVEEASRVAGEFFRGVRQAALALPTRIGQAIPTLTAFDRQTIAGLVRDMLSELSEDAAVTEGLVPADAGEG